MSHWESICLSLAAGVSPGRPPWATVPCGAAGWALVGTRASRFPPWAPCTTAATLCPPAGGTSGPSVAVYLGPRSGREWRHLVMCSLPSNSSGIWKVKGDTSTERVIRVPPQAPIYSPQRPPWSRWKKNASFGQGKMTNERGVEGMGGYPAVVAHRRTPASQPEASGTLRESSQCLNNLCFVLFSSWNI